MSTSTLMAANELARLPKDGFRYELVRGELHQMSPAGFEHGEIALLIGSHLLQFVKRRKLGTVVSCDPGFKLESNPDTVRAPDVAYVSHERLQRITDRRAFADIAPDLAIEVLSPGDSPAKLATKSEAWLRAGTLAVVVVNPRRRMATVYLPGGTSIEFTAADVLEVPSVLPGWKMPINEIFE